jgi:hypothetical protein
MPLALIAAGLAGLAIDPAAQPAPVHGARRKSRYRQDNDLVWNPGAFVAAAGLIGFLVLIAVLIEVL